MALGHFSKLGPAPFKLVDLVGPDDFHQSGQTPFEGYDGNTDRCDCCGSKISWRAILHDADGKPHVVGRTCAANATDLEGVSLRDAELKAKKKMVSDWMVGQGGKAFRDWCSKQPHPKNWKGKNLLDDLRYWCGRGPEKGLPKLRKAFKAFGKGDATELLVEEKRAQDHRIAKKQEKAAPWIRCLLIEKMKAGSPWEHFDLYDDNPELRAKVKADLEMRHGPEPDWTAKKAEIEAMTPAELWAEADKRMWIIRGRFIG